MVSRNITFLLLFLMPFSWQIYSQSTDFSAIFEDDYHEAELFIENNKAVITEHWGTLSPILLPVVFPELIRYSTFRDMLETSALKMIYREKGSKVVDFSIGYFQIKPSFAEQLECWAHYKKDSSALVISHALRQEILQKLQTLEGQLQYLLWFHQFIQERYAARWPSEPAEQVLLLAAHFNAGLYISTENLLKTIKTPRFPYGARFPGKQYCYHEVASFYFQKNH